MFVVYVGCGGNLIGTVGSFSSPGHPNHYPHGVTCDWYISAEPGMVIRLTFNTFNLEHNQGCQYDYVQVYDKLYQYRDRGRPGQVGGRGHVGRGWDRNRLEGAGAERLTGG